MKASYMSINRMLVGILDICAGGVNHKSLYFGEARPNEGLLCKLGLPVYVSKSKKL